MRILLFTLMASFVLFFPSDVSAQNQNYIEKIVDEVKCGMPNSQFDVCCDPNFMRIADVPELYIDNYLDDSNGQCDLPEILNFCFESPARWVAKAFILPIRPVLEHYDRIDDQEQSFRCFVGVPRVDNNNACTCAGGNSSTVSLCLNYFDENIPSEKDELEACVKCSENGVWTGLGCIYTDTEDFIVKNVFGTMLSLAGFLALLCIVYSAIKMQTSQGDSEKIQSARESLIACVGGILLVIFSLLIIRIIGVDILGLPFLS